MSTKKLSAKIYFISFFFILNLNGISAATDSKIEKAVPIWAKGKEKEMNLTPGFRTKFTTKNKQKTNIKITASTLYRVYLNGEFIGSGPARAAHGYFRVDEYPVDKQVKEGENILAIEVAGYNMNSYYTLDQPSFLLTEVEIDGKIIVATGQENDFEAFQLKERLQRVERSSFQRPFSEYYWMTEGYDQWRNSTEKPTEKIELAKLPLVTLLPHHVAMPLFEIKKPVNIHSLGTIKKIVPPYYHKDRALTGIGKNFKGFAKAELEVYPISQEIQEIVTASQEVLR